MVFSRKMSTIVIYVFLFLQLLSVSARASEDFPAPVSGLLALHGQKKTIDDITRHYLKFGHFWVVDFTLNDVNAAVEEVMHAAGRFDADGVFAGIDRITSLSVYVPVLLQDILAAVRSEKIRKLLSHYSRLMEEVRGSLELADLESNNTGDKIIRLKALAESLGWEIKQLQKQREDLNSEIRMLKLYSIGYSAKLSLLLAPRIYSKFNPARFIPFVSLFINSLWIGSELNQRKNLQSAFEILTEELRKTESLLETLKTEHPLVLQVLRLKRAFILQNITENSFSKKVNTLTLGYAVGDMALATKGVLAAAGIKLGLVATAAVTVTGIGAAVLGVTALLAVGGRYVYKNRHSLTYHWYRHQLSRKIDKAATRLATLHPDADEDQYGQQKKYLDDLVLQKETLESEYADLLLSGKFSGVQQEDISAFRQSLRMIQSSPGILDSIRTYLTEFGRYSSMYMVEPVRTVFRFITTVRLTPQEA